MKMIMIRRNFRPNMIFCQSVIMCVKVLIADQKTYHIRNSVIINNNGDVITQLVVMLPLAQSNRYQTVTNVSVNNGVSADIPGTDDKYLRWTYTGGLPKPGESKEVFYTFTVTLNPVDFDFGAITTLHPYDTSSDVYKRYTDESGVYVVPDNATISRIGRQTFSN